MVPISSPGWKGFSTKPGKGSLDVKMDTPRTSRWIRKTTWYSHHPFVIRSQYSTRENIESPCSSEKKPHIYSLSSTIVLLIIAIVKRPRQVTAIMVHHGGASLSRQRVYVVDVHQPLPEPLIIINNDICLSNCGCFIFPVLTRFPGNSFMVNSCLKTLNLNLCLIFE